MNMSKQAPRSAAASAVRILDACILVAAMPVAYFLRDAILGQGRAELYPIEHYWPLLSVTLLLWVAVSWALEIYVSYRTRSVVAELARIARALAIVGIAAAGLAFLFKQHDVSRLLVGLYFAIALVALGANRMGMRALARAVRRRGYNGRIYAVVGAGDLAHDVIESLADHADWGYELAGYVLGSGDQAPARGNVLGRLADLGDLLETRVLDEVIFALPQGPVAEIEKAILLCEEQGVAVRVCLDVGYHRRVFRMSLGELAGIPTVGLSRTPSDTLQLVAKRAFDIAASGLALLVLSPALLAAAAAIKLDSGGPIFFRQKRVGLNGRAFTILKFRSMYQDAEARQEGLRRFNEMSGPVFKMANDPRITRVGEFLRRTSLDEFPQFWNVLKGEMSIVGPRPPIPSEVRQYKRWQRRRLSVKPGITCTWQVSGRNQIDFDRWMELDLQYIDTWSLWGDLQICLRTIPAVLSSRGAH